jgi:hypothetical protein
MRPACFGQCPSSGISPGCGSISDPATFHFCYLRQNSEDQFADASTDGAKAMNIDGHSGVDQSPDGSLHVERIAPEPIHRVDMNRVPCPHLIEEFAKSGTLSGHCSAADAFVGILAVKGSAHRVALGFDALISGGNSIIGDTHTVAHKLGVTDG